MNKYETEAYCQRFRQIIMEALGRERTQFNPATTPGFERMSPKTWLARFADAKRGFELNQWPNSWQGQSLRCLVARQLPSGEIELINRALGRKVIEPQPFTLDQFNIELIPEANSVIKLRSQLLELENAGNYGAEYLALLTKIKTLERT